MKEVRKKNRALVSSTSNTILVFGWRIHLLFHFAATTFAFLLPSLILNRNCAQLLISLRRQLVIIHSTVFLVADSMSCVDSNSNNNNNSSSSSTVTVACVSHANCLVIYACFILQTDFITHPLTKSIFTFVFTQTSNMSAIISEMKPKHTYSTLSPFTHIVNQFCLGGSILTVSVTKPCNIFMDMRHIFYRKNNSQHRNEMHFSV